jgi:DNA-binding MarR family transcriptional regulator
MTTTTPTPPVLTGRHIGAASRATGALLDQLLDEADLPFGEWTVLFTLAGTGPLAPDELVRQQADGLKVPEATVRATVDGLLASGLIGLGLGPAGGDSDGRLVLTAAGEAVFRPISDAVGRITADLYGDLPAADLEATRRTLEEVTRRANARLAG